MARATNKSQAVVQQRSMPHDSLDFFPTPPWAVRALFATLDRYNFEYDNSSVWEPACGRGDMSRVLNEYFYSVFSSDIHNYGYGNDVQDFLFPGYKKSCAAIFTNPPFKLAEQFIMKALTHATDCVGIFARSAFSESQGRYERLFSKYPPAIVLQYAERVSCVPGRLDPDANLPTAYSWFIWRVQKFEKDWAEVETKYVWIAPLRDAMERPGDWPDLDLTEVKPAPLFDGTGD